MINLADDGPVNICGFFIKFHQGPITEPQVDGHRALLGYFIQLADKLGRKCRVLSWYNSYLNDYNLRSLAQPFDKIFVPACRHIEEESIRL